MKNKTMKRILPALLLAVLVLGMTGCGQTQSEPDVSATAETTDRSGTTIGRPTTGFFPRGARASTPGMRER